MGKLIDLTGQHFGELIVISRGSNTKDNQAQWNCKCSCGKELLISSKTLRKGSIFSCGCKRITRCKDISNQKFGLLIAIEPIGHDNSNKKLWKCRCDCGNEKIIRASDLIAGKIKSCGCLKTEVLSSDLTGKRFGYLTAIKQIGQGKRKDFLWLCKCDCGGEIIVSTNNLTSGNTQSCGCLVSKGEIKICNWLKEHNISFAKQFVFPDLLGKNKTPLRFDVAILENDKPIKLIEFQGPQHYTNIFKLSAEEWEYSLQRDEMKRQYCKEKDIPLLEIKYNEAIEEKLELFIYEN